MRSGGRAPPWTESTAAISAFNAIAVAIHDAIIRVPTGVDGSMLNAMIKDAPAAATISMDAWRRLFVSTRPVDFRESVHGLVALMTMTLRNELGYLATSAAS